MQYIWVGHNDFDVGNIHYKGHWKGWAMKLKIKNIKKSDLISKVKSLKKVNLEDRDNNAIFRAESALSNFVEREIKF